MKRVHYRKSFHKVTLCHRRIPMDNPLVDENIRKVTCKACLHQIVSLGQYHRILHSIWYKKAKDAELSLKRYEAERDQTPTFSIEAPHVHR